MNALHASPAGSSVARNEDLLHSIEEHKYFINQSLPFEVSMKDAFESWTLLVQDPLAEAISDTGLHRAFPSLTKEELFLQVSNHWYFLKEKDADITAEEAVLNFGTKFAPDAMNRFGFFLKKITY